MRLGEPGPAPGFVEGGGQLSAGAEVLAGTTNVDLGFQGFRVSGFQGFRVSGFQGFPYIYFCVSLVVCCSVGA